MDNQGKTWNRWYSLCLVKMKRHAHDRAEFIYVPFEHVITRRKDNLVVGFRWSVDSFIKLLILPLIHPNKIETLYLQH